MTNSSQDSAPILRLRSKLRDLDSLNKKPRGCLYNPNSRSGRSRARLMLGSHAARSMLNGTTVERALTNFRSLARLLDLPDLMVEAIRLALGLPGAPTEAQVRLALGASIEEACRLWVAGSR